MAAVCMRVSAQVQAGVCVCGAIHPSGWQAGRTGCLRFRVSSSSSGRCAQQASGKG
jgi:hypothetical protein